MSNQKIIDDDTLKRVLGFQIPGLTQEQAQKIIKESQHNKDLQQRMRQEENSTPYEVQVNKYYKTNSEKRKGIVKLDIEGMNSYSVQGVPLESLTETQKAYFWAYDPQKVILSDIESSKQAQKIAAGGGGQQGAQNQQSNQINNNNQVQSANNFQLQNYTNENNEEGNVSMNWVYTINSKANNNTSVITNNNSSNVVFNANSNQNVQQISQSATNQQTTFPTAAANSSNIANGGVILNNTNINNNNQQQQQQQAGANLAKKNNAGTKGKNQNLAKLKEEKTTVTKGQSSGNNNTNQEPQQQQVTVGKEKKQKQNQKQKNQGTQQNAGDQNNQEEKERVCLCNKEYDGEFMISCSNDDCRMQWFHPACVNIQYKNEKEIESLDWVCSSPTCRDSGKNCENEEEE